MRTAVVQVDPDPARALRPRELDAGVRALHGVSLHRRDGDRVLQLLVEADGPGDARRRAATACATAFGTAPSVGTVTFVSRGTDEDALGVVAAFGLHAHLQRLDEDGEEVAVVTLVGADPAAVPESRLHTALEAALNCEIRLGFG